MVFVFNVRVKRYLDTEQIQIFSEPLKSKDSECEDDRKVNFETGEIVPTNRKLIYNPFDDEMIIGYDIGNDEDNLARSVRRTKNKIYDIARSNKWEWFFTLTFNPDKVDSFSYEDVTYKLSKWLNNMRRTCPDMKYLVVPEQHESGRWHFHGLFLGVDDMVFVDSGKLDKRGRIVYNVGNYRLGWTTATKIDSLERAMSYIAKYTTEELCAVTKGHKRYWCSRNIDLPIVEDFFCEGQEALKRELLDKIELLYSKDVFSDFVDVTYIELPIYTINTSSLSQMNNG